MKFPFAYKLLGLLLYSGWCYSVMLDGGFLNPAKSTSKWASTPFVTFASDPGEYTTQFFIFGSIGLFFLIWVCFDIVRYILRKITTSENELDV